ncbi:MAG TPA: hypothetical protein V6D23_00375 [Candidatus Obscuribacterales bacterium]
MERFNPHAFWVFSLVTPQGVQKQVHYLKSRDQPALCALVWSALQGEKPDWSRLPAADLDALRQARLLSFAGRWQMPPEVYVAVHTCLRGAGLRPFIFAWNAENRPFLARTLEALQDSGQNPGQGPDICQGLPAEWRETWRQIGLLADEALIPDAVYLNDFPPGRLLDLLPYRQRLELAPEADQPVEPGQSVLSQRIEAVWQRAFRPGSRLLWSRDPVYGLLNPFCAYDWLLQGLASREQPASRVPDPSRLLLRAGHLLQPQGMPAPGSSYPALAAGLEQQAWLVLPKLFSPLLLATLRAYLRASYANGFFQDDNQDSGRDTCHNEPLMQLLHRELLPGINQIVPAPVKASYCYLAIYNGGAVLPRHIDRKLCAWNLSLVLDLEPETSGRQVWPIYLEMAPGDVRAVYLEMGDGVLYQGSRFPHWRNALPADHRVAVCFFHFVTEDYVGFLY